MHRLLRIISVLLPAVFLCTFFTPATPAQEHASIIWTNGPCCAEYGREVDIVTTPRRVESFDVLAADQYAEVVTAREQNGQPISVSDAQIAAICRVLNATLATRNTSDFTGTGVNLINPWKTAEG